MKIIEPSVELINAPDYKTLLTTIEAAGRTCYKKVRSRSVVSSLRITCGFRETQNEIISEMPIKGGTVWDWSLPSPYED